MKYILKGGTIVDGTRAKPYIGSVVIKDGIIEDIITGDVHDGENVVDVIGKIVSPGFIDIHSHSDISYFMPHKQLSKLYQGITTEIVGNCGVSAIPTSENSLKGVTKYLSSILEVSLGNKIEMPKNMIEYKDSLNKAKLPVNIGILVGHGTLRGTVMGFDDREPTEVEMDNMCRILDYELKNGALGLSLGLIYPPGSFSNTYELIRLAEVIKDNNGILSVHMRNEGDHIFEAVDEILEVTRKTGVHLHIAHLKLIGKNQWRKSNLLLKKIEDEQANGLNITCDQYPYDATSTSLSALLPRWAHDGGTEKMLKRLMSENNQLDNDIRKEMEGRGGPSSVVVSGTKGYMTEVEGLSIKEASKLLGLNPVDTVKNILLTTKANVAAIYHSLDHDDMLNIMKKMYISVGSDGYAFSLDPKVCKTNPHPRNFGSFPRFLEITRDKCIMSIEDAIYKMTKLTADTLGIIDRGVLSPRKAADITVFDYEKIGDNSTFLNSVQKPVGIEHIFVNGRPALLYGKEKFLGSGKVIVK